MIDHKRVEDVKSARVSKVNGRDRKSIRDSLDVVERHWESKDQLEIFASAVDSRDPGKIT